MSNPDFSINPYHQIRHHPARFTFVKVDISIKDQERMKDFIKNALHIEVRVKRESGLAIFMTTQDKVSKAKKYFYDRADILIQEFNIRNFELDVDKEMFENKK